MSPFFSMFLRKKVHGFVIVGSTHVTDLTCSVHLFTDFTFIGSKIISIWFRFGNAVVPLFLQCFGVDTFLGG